MPGSAKQKKIDELLEKNREALRHNACFEAERVALKALVMARQDHDFARMAACVPPLLEARRLRMQHAVDAGVVTVIEGPITDDMKVKPGCYIVQPPQVGSDARRLRTAALNSEVPVAVVCREPLTRQKLAPIVAISPGSTLRVRIDPPARDNPPSMAWFVGALEALGDWAIESLDATLPIIRRIDSLIEFLDALPEHENLHFALEAACREAQQNQEAQAAQKASKPGGKARIKS